MRYRGQALLNHASKPKIGVLLTNLGTPDAPNKRALRRYLKQFLSDPRVVEIPRLLWWPILNGIILNTRPAKSAKLYQSIWTERGSPLAFHTQDQTKLLAEKLENDLDRLTEEILVRYAMRYGNPSIGQTVEELLTAGADKIVVLPLYPQYAGSTTGSTFDAIAAQLKTMRWLPSLRFINHYHDNPQYIDACANRIREHWETKGKHEKLLLSFHGLPKFHHDQGDPYFCQCRETAQLIRAALEIDESDLMVTFQSRFGRAEWLQPYTDKTLEQLAQQGVESVDIFCPGFAADCLETLEEIAVENKNYFLQAGGKQYAYISALNTRGDHIDTLASMIKTCIADWLTQQPQP